MRATCRPGLRGQRVPLVPQRLVAVGAEQRDRLGAPTRAPAASMPAHRLVDGVLGHHPVGRVLAAGDDDQPGHRVADDVLAGQLARSTRTRRPAAAAARRRRPRRRRGSAARPAPVDVVEQVVDVGAVAAGWALSRFQSVSVVPMIQCRPHGMTNSTRLLGAQDQPGAWSGCRSRGTTRWMPLEARTWNCPRSPAIAWVSSVHTPVALMTCLARTSNSRPVSRSHHPRAGDPLALAQEADDAGAVGDVRAVARGGAHERHRVPGVVDLARRSTAPRRSSASACRPGASAARAGGCRCRWCGTPAAVPRDAAPSCRRAARRSRRTAAPSTGASAGRGTAPAGPGAGRAGCSSSPRSCSASRTSAEVEHLQVAQAAVDQLAGPAGRAAGEVARLDQADGQAAGDGVERACPAPTTPPPMTRTSSSSWPAAPGRVDARLRVTAPMPCIRRASFRCATRAGTACRSTSTRRRPSPGCARPPSSSPRSPSSRCSSVHCGSQRFDSFQFCAQLVGVVPEAGGQAGGVGRAERGGLGDHRPADRHAEDVGLDLHAQVVGGDAAVDLEHVEVDAGVLLHRVDDVAALVADRLQRGPGQVGVGVEAGQADDRAAGVASASTARTGRRTPARSTRRRCPRPARASDSLSAAPEMMPSWSRSHCTAEPVTAIEPSRA